MEESCRLCEKFLTRCKGLTRDKDRRKREGKKEEEEEVIIESETVTVYDAISQQVRWKSRTKVPSWLVFHSVVR